MRHRRVTPETETRSALKLAKILADLELIPSGAKIRIIRLRPGHWQRSAGAWSWVAQELSKSDDGKSLVFKDVCGSVHPVSEILTAEKVVRYIDKFGDITLYSGKNDDESITRESY